MGCGYHLRWTNLLLSLLLACLLKDAATCTRRSGSTAGKTYEILCAQTQTDENISDQPKTLQHHLRSVHASELGLSLSLKPAFLKATTTQKMLLPVLHYIYVYLLSLLSVCCVCVDASVYYLQVWDKKKDSKEATLSPPLQNQVL